MYMYCYFLTDGGECDMWLTQTVKIFLIEIHFSLVFYFK